MTHATQTRKDFLSVLDLDAAELERCLQLAAQLKSDRSLGRHAPTAEVLNGRHVAMLFHKPSLRTFSTFEIAIRELGGHLVTLQPDVAFGLREPVADVARNLERWVDGVVIRTYWRDMNPAGSRGRAAATSSRAHGQGTLPGDRRFPDAGEHRTGAGAPSPMSATATTWRRRRPRRAMLGVHVHIASPEPYQLPHAVVQQATAVARHGARLRLFSDAADAVAGADAVYTDTWTSMGQEAEADVRRRIFAPYQVNDELISLAKPGALFMHCLPAHRGEEVTADVFESDASVVFDQAENRLHGQKALLLMLLAPTAGI
jgi:ornithine carbamoyltransferase